MRNQHEKFAFVAVLLMKLLLMTLKNDTIRLLDHTFYFQLLTSALYYVKYRYRLTF